MPREGTLVIDDLVRGQVEFEWAREQDHVVQRTDGTCLYHLASVVDDFDFQITHVIRAEEHLSNTPRQIFIAQSLGYPLPAYAHLPYVAEPGSKNKLSKRKLDKYLKNRDFALVNEHGAGDRQGAGTGDHGRHVQPRDRRFLRSRSATCPTRSSTTCCCWAGRSTTRPSFFTRQQMIENFSLERVTKAPASFDPKKLWAFQDHYMQALPLKQKVAAMLKYLQRAGLVAVAGAVRSGPETDADRRGGGRSAESVRRHHRLRRLLLSVRRDLRREGLREEHRASRAPPSCWPGFATRWPRVEPFDVAHLEAALNAFVEREQIKTGDIIHAVRVAATGKPVGPGLYDCLEILGKPVVLERIDRALAKAAAQ